jgi:DNA uptake protein ComE-like DNA-binding protein
VHPTRYIKGLAVAVTVFCLAAGPWASPAAAQSGAPQSAKTRPIPPPEDRIDINHASAEELMTVPGITASWTGRIIRYRPYRTKQDLLDRGVLPGNVYDRIKDYVIAHREKQ